MGTCVLVASWLRYLCRTVSLERIIPAYGVEALAGGRLSAVRTLVLSPGRLVHFFVSPFASEKRKQKQVTVDDYCS